MQCTLRPTYRLILAGDSTGLHLWVPTGFPPSASRNPALRLVCSQGGKHQLILKLTHIIVIRGGKSQTRVPFVLSLPYSISICPFQWRGSGYATPICGSIAYRVGRIRQRACARRIFWSSSEAGHKTLLWEGSHYAQRKAMSLSPKVQRNLNEQASLCPPSRYS